MMINPKACFSKIRSGRLRAVLLDPRTNSAAPLQGQLWSKRAEDDSNPRNSLPSVDISLVRGSTGNDEKCSHIHCRPAHSLSGYISCRNTSITQKSLITSTICIHIISLEI